MFDARGWITWLLAMTTLTMITRNPLYIILIMLVARVVGAVCAVSTTSLQLPLGRIGVIILLFATGFNTLFSHAGETLLWQLPAAWPLIGGPLTFEAAVYGAVNGLILITLLVIFTSFNHIVPIGELVRLAPPALRDLAVVILIAITYLPETMHQLRRIREAQAIRGHQMRGIQDWPPLVLPLLIGGLERAMGIAEAMVSRGYGSTTDNKQPFAVQLMLFLGLCAVFAGWTMSFWYGVNGWLVMGLGILIIFLLLRQLGRNNPTTQYQPTPMSLWNIGLMVTAVAATFILIWKPAFLNISTLQYSPYPRFELPLIQGHISLLILLFLFPALATLRRRAEPVAESVHKTPAALSGASIFKENEYDRHS